jgi:zinc transporter ZupT
MLTLDNRIAKICALLLLVGLMMLGAPQIRASAQGVHVASLEQFARPAAPIVREYTPWASDAGTGMSIKTFSMTPQTTGIVVGVFLVTILLANIRIRPRHARR